MKGPLLELRIRVDMDRIRIAIQTKGKHGSGFVRNIKKLHALLSVSQCYADTLFLKIDIYKKGFDIFRF